MASNGQICRQRDEAGKPENHGNRIHGGDDEAMGEVGKVSGREGKIWSRDECGPDAIKEHEIDG